MSPLLISHPPRTLPWEMLQHIFSHCDQSTLVAVCLTSFLCWELAGPILYETVEISNLDALLSLFFIEYTTSSNRFNPSNSLLTRIKTLSLEIQSSKQTREPFFDLPDDRLEDEDPDDIHIDAGNWDFGLQRERKILDPHRLLASTSSSPLPIRTLVLVDWILPSFALQNFLPDHLFSHLSPRSLVLQTKAFLNQFGRRWTSMAGIYFSPRFLESWNDLERIVFAGMSVKCWYRDSRDEWDAEIAGIWGESHEGGKLELVFDFALGGVDVRRERAPPERALMMAVLDLGGMKKGLASLVDLKVVMRVEKGRESSAEKQIARDLDEWMKPFVRVEGV